MKPIEPVNLKADHQDCFQTDVCLFCLHPSSNERVHTVPNELYYHEKRSRVRLVITLYIKWMKQTLWSLNAHGGHWEIQSLERWLVNYGSCRCVKSKRVHVLKSAGELVFINRNPCTVWTSPHTQISNFFRWPRICTATYSTESSMYCMYAPAVKAPSHRIIN